MTLTRWSARQSGGTQCPIDGLGHRCCEDSRSVRIPACRSLPKLYHITGIVVSGREMATRKMDRPANQNQL
jgi:hypothetical protein